MYTQLMSFLQNTTYRNQDQSKDKGTEEADLKSDSGAWFTKKMYNNFYPKFLVK